MNRQRGFTLVELLVVIAIIGILSSVVLSNLNSARTKASDAATKGELANVRAQAQIYHDTNNNYNSNLTDTDPPDVNTDCVDVAGTLTSDPYVQQQFNPITTKYGGTNLKCVVGYSTYAVSVTMKGGDNWCVDSSGAATTTVAIDATGTCE